MFKVVIVDDYPMVRIGLHTLFSIDEDMQVVGMGSNGYEAIELCRLYAPDILVIDYHMPLLDGISAIRHIRREFPKLMIVLLSSFGDDTLTDNMLSGVNLHLLKDSRASDILSTIRRYVVARIAKE